MTPLPPQVHQMMAKDSRVKLTGQVFRSIKLLKLYAWEQAYENRIFKCREEEVRPHTNIVVVLGQMYESQVFCSWKPYGLLPTLQRFPHSTPSYLHLLWLSSHSLPTYWGTNAMFWTARRHLSPYPSSIFWRIQWTCCHRRSVILFRYDCGTLCRQAL